MKRLLLVLLCTGVIALAQDDPLEEHFVPPEQIMRHQSELGITAAQREEIKQQVRNAQMRFTELQWDLRADLETLSKLLEDRNVSEDAVIEQLDNVLAVEADIKRTQLSMLIALRKVLTEGQLEEARALANQGFPSARKLREIQRQAEIMSRTMRKVEEASRRVMQKRYRKSEKDPAAPGAAGARAGVPAAAPAPPLPPRN